MRGESGCMAMEDANVVAESLSGNATVAGTLAYVARRRWLSWVQQESDAVAWRKRRLSFLDQTIRLHD